MVQRKEDLNSNFFRASGIYDARGVADEEPNTGHCFPEGTVFRMTTPDTVDNVSDYNNFPLATITGGNKDHFALGLAMYCECQTGTNYGARGWIPVIWVHDTAGEDDRAAAYASGRPNALTQNDFVKPLRPFSVSIAHILCQGNQIDTNEWRNPDLRMKMVRVHLRKVVKTRADLQRKLDVLTIQKQANDMLATGTSPDDVKQEISSLRTTVQSLCRDLGKSIDLLGDSSSVEALVKGQAPAGPGERPTTAGSSPAYNSGHRSERPRHSTRGQQRRT